MLCTSLVLLRVNTGLNVARNLGILCCYYINLAIMKVYVLKILHFLTQMFESSRIFVVPVFQNGALTTE